MNFREGKNVKQFRINWIQTIKINYSITNWASINQGNEYDVKLFMKGNFPFSISLKFSKSITM